MKNYIKNFFYLGKKSYLCITINVMEYNDIFLIVAELFKTKERSLNELYPKVLTKNQLDKLKAIVYEPGTWTTSSELKSRVITNIKICRALYK